MCVCVWTQAPHGEGGPHYGLIVVCQAVYRQHQTETSQREREGQGGEVEEEDARSKRGRVSFAREKEDVLGNQSDTVSPSC